MQSTKITEQNSELLRIQSVIQIMKIHIEIFFNCNPKFECMEILEKNESFFNSKIIRLTPEGL